MRARSREQYGREFCSRSAAKSLAGRRRASASTPTVAEESRTRSRHVKDMESRSPSSSAPATSGAARTAWRTAWSAPPPTTWACWPP